MLGFGRQVSFGLAGWLWADLLLGLFAIFLAANAAIPQAQAAHPGLSAEPITMTVTVNGARLLSDDVAEERRVAAEIQTRFDAVAAGRRVAIVFAYGVHARPSDGDLLASRAMTFLRDGAFAEAKTRAYHELTPGDNGTAVKLEIFVYD